MSLGVRPLLLMIFAGLLGAAGSIHLHRWALQQDDERIRAAAEFRAEWRANDLAWKLETIGQGIDSLAALIAADPEISLETFRRIRPEPLQRVKSLTALGWAPRVGKDERDRFEAGVRAAGIPEFGILEPDSGAFVSARDRAEYFPLLHGWVFDGPPAVLGLDALAIADVRVAAHAARDSGQLTTTLPLRSAVTGLLTLQPVAPVYIGDDVPTDTDERRARLRGYVIGRMPLVEALNRATQETPQIFEDIYLFVEGGLAEGKVRSLVEYDRQSRGFTVSDRTLDLAALPGIVVMKSIKVLNTQWVSAFHFPPEFLVGQRSQGLWGLLAAGLLATAGILLFVGYQASRSAHSERLVAARTADLRREMEERKQIEQTSSAIIEQSPFAIVGLRPDRRVMLWNRAAERIFGYAAAEALGRPYRLVPTEGLAEFDRIIDRVSAGERLVDIEVRRRRKDGTLVDIVFSGAPLYGSDGHLSGLVFVLQDVTERKGIEAQLRQSQKMEAIGQLSGGIAHDFNNALGAIIGNLEIALDESRDIARIHGIVETVIGIAGRGGELVQRLLAFARRQMLVPRRIDVSAILDATLPILRRTLGESIAIDGIHERGLWPVVADQAQLESALLNLAINARDAMPRGGTLTVSASNTVIDPQTAPGFPDLRPGEYVLIAVADTGAGMPPEIASRAFEPFFTTKDTGKGTGLGLSMVYGFLRQSGGTAKIYSEVGHGTAVHLYLPRAQPAAGEAKSGAEASGSAPRGRERVLVVEDNPEVRDIACTLLTGLGYRITACGNGAEALRLLDTGERFDLLFSDVVMPGMSGIELAEETRRRYPEIQVLLTSGFASPVAVRDQAKAIGLEVLAKPYRRMALARKVREVLDAPAHAGGA